MFRFQFPLHAIGQFNIANSFLFLLVGFNLQVECRVIDQSNKQPKVLTNKTFIFYLSDRFYIYRLSTWQSYLIFNTQRYEKIFEMRNYLIDYQLSNCSCILYIPLLLSLYLEPYN